MPTYYIAKDVVYLYSIEANSEDEAIQEVYTGDLYPDSEEIVNVSAYAKSTPTNEGAI